MGNRGAIRAGLVSCPCSNSNFSLTDMYLEEDGNLIVQAVKAKN
jgi:hypothetical protein